MESGFSVTGRPALVPDDIATPDSLHAAKIAFDGYAPMPAGDFAAPLTGADLFSSAPLPRTSDPFVLDTDPFGERGAAWGARTGVPVTTSDVQGLSVFGRQMSRDSLMQTEDGRRLLKLTEDTRRGRKRGFFDAITDFKWSDVPFLSLFADVGGSILDGRRVSETLRKLQNREFVSDEDLVKTRLYMAEQEYRGNGSWGATVGDIVRAAPGFMVEFLASGGIYSAARVGATKLAAAAGSKWATRSLATLAVNRATKKLGSELAEFGVREAVKNELGREVSSTLMREGVRKLGDDAVKGVTKKLSDTLFSQLKASTMGTSDARRWMMSKAFKDGFDDAVVRQVADNLAVKYTKRAIAREGASNAFTGFMRGAWDATKDSFAAGVLDHGMTWGTESGTQLFFKHNSAGRALTDAITGMFLEAPIRGAMQFGLNRAVTVPIRAAGGVSASQLELQESALRTNNRSLMENAEAISMGIGFLEFASENAGRGIGSLLRAGGLATGLSKQAGRRMVGEFGSALAEVPQAQAGGFLRGLVRKAVGTPEEWAERNRGQRVDAVLAALNRRAKDEGVPAFDRVAAATVANGALPAGRPDAASIVGDVGKFVKTAMDESFRDELGRRQMKAYARYTLSDIMSRHGWGPDTVMDLWEAGGYDGILGEIFEERYSDFAKNLFGWDDKKTHSMKENLQRAFESVTPGVGLEFSQLLAEAVGFAVPMATRTAVLGLQRKLGDSSEVSRMRAIGENYDTLLRAMDVVEATPGQHVKNIRRTMTALVKEKADVEAKIAEERKVASDAGLVGEAAEARVKPLTQQAESLQKRIDAQLDSEVKFLKATGLGAYAKLNATAIERVSPFYEVDWAAATAKGVDVESSVAARPRSSETEKGSFDEKTDVGLTPGQAAEAIGAKDAALDSIAGLWRSSWKARQDELDEDGNRKPLPMWRRIAGKVAGIAGALVTAEPSLAFSDSSNWAAVDGGLDPSLVDKGVNLYDRMRKEAIRRLERSVAPTSPAGSTYNFSEEDIEREMENVEFGGTLGYRAAARNLAKSLLFVKGVRMFSQSAMLDQAIVHEAEKRGYRFETETGLLVRDTTSEIYGYESLPEGATPISANPNDARVSRKSVPAKESVTLAEFYASSADVKAAVDARRDGIAVASLRLLSDGLLGQRTGTEEAAPVLRIPVGSSIEEKANLRLAVNSLGMSDLVTVTDLEHGVSIETQLNGSDVTLDGNDVSDIAKATVDLSSETIAADIGADSTSTLRAKIARVAQAMRYPTGGQSDADFNKMYREIIRICRELDSVVDRENTIAFSAPVDPTRVRNPRLLDQENRIVYGHRRGDGRWYLDAEAYDSSTKQTVIPESFATRDELVAFMSGLDTPFHEVPIGARFTQCSVFRTEDPMLMAKKLGLAGRILQRTIRRNPDGTQDWSHVPHVLRKGADGKYLYDDTPGSGKKITSIVSQRSEADVAMSVSLAKAQLWKDSNEGTNPDPFFRTEDERKAYNDEAEKELAEQPVHNVIAQRMREAEAEYKAAYDEHGYMTVIDEVLGDAGVVTPSNNAGLSALTALTGRHEYRASLSSYTARGSQTATTFIPIDFGKAQDYSAAIMNAALEHAFTSSGRLLARRADGTPGRWAGTVRDFAKVIRAAAEELYYSAGVTKEQATALKSYINDVVPSPEHVTSKEFSQIVSEFILFRIERDRALGVSQTAHSQAAALIADKVRSSREFVSMYVLVDLMLGGDGLSAEAVRTATGTAKTSVPPAPRGIARLLGLFDDPSVRETVRKAFNDFKPCGMSASEFVSKVNSTAAAMTRRPVGTVDANPSDTTGFLEALRQAVAGVDTSDPTSVDAVLDRIATDLGSGGKSGPAARTAIKGIRELYTAMRDSLEEGAKRIAGLQAEKDKADKALADEQGKNRADIASYETQAKHLREELNDAQAKQAAAEERARELEVRVAQLQASEQASGKAAVTEKLAGNSNGDASAPTVTAASERGGETNESVKLTIGKSGTSGTRPARTVLNKNLRNRKSLTISYDIDPSDAYLDLDDAGNLVVRDSETRRESDFDSDSIPYGVNIVLNSLLARTTIVSSQDAFLAAVAEFFPSMNDEEKLTLWFAAQPAIRRINAAKDSAAEARNDFADANDLVDAQNEGVQSASEQYNQKSLDLLNSKPLRCFLAFAFRANPLGGKNLQAFFNMLRDDVAAMRAEASAEGTTVPENVKAALDVVDELLNPRALTMDDVKTACDREAVFSDRVNSLLDGGTGVDTLIAALLGKDKNGNAWGRIPAFFLSYLRSLEGPARRSLMQLAANAAVCDRGAVSVGRSKDKDGKTKSFLKFGTKIGRPQSVAMATVLGAFAPAFGKSAAGVRKMISDIVAGFKAHEKDFATKSKGKSSVAADIRDVRRNLAAMRAVLAPVLGRENPLVQAISHDVILDHLKYAASFGTEATMGPARNAYSTLARQTGLAVVENAAYGFMPETIRTVCGILEDYAAAVEGFAGNPTLKNKSGEALARARAHLEREAMTRVATVGIMMGTSTEDVGFAHKSSQYTTGWMRILSTYAASLPETIARTVDAHDGRSAGNSSSVAVTARGVIPVVSQWMDIPLYEAETDENGTPKTGLDGKPVKKYNETGFAFIAKNKLTNAHPRFFGKDVPPERRNFASMTDEEFEERVLPWCRQHMCWPDAYSTPILVKNISADYTADEVINACREGYNRDFAPIRGVREEVKNPDGSIKVVMKKARVTSSTKKDPLASDRWFVPIYSGEHSGSSILQMPRLTDYRFGGKWQPVAGSARVSAKEGDRTVGEYELLADGMYECLGLAKLGTDAKRAQLSSNESPGVSMRGIHVDRTTGKVTKGECRICVVQNLNDDMVAAGKEGSESLIGSSVCYGYGARQQQLLAKDPLSQLLKTHVMSASGEDLSLFKSLTTAVSEDSAKGAGSFLEDFALGAIERHIAKIHKGLRNSELSTVFACDMDALKVSIGNSKMAGVVVNGKRMTLFGYVFSKIREDIARNGGKPKAYAGQALDNLLADEVGDGKFEWQDEASPSRSGRRTIGELLGAGADYVDADGNPSNGIQVDVVDGMNGDKAVSFSYVDNSLMSYTVANVSHEASEVTGRTPKNNLIDALTMAAVQLRGKLAPESKEELEGLVRHIANWGVMAAVVGTDGASVDAMRFGTSLRRLLEIGESAGGINYENQLARDVFSKLQKAMNIPLVNVPCALVSGGAVWSDKLGRVVDNTKDPMLRALHLGSTCYGYTRRKWMGVSRRLGDCQINVRNDGFRYGLFLDMVRLRELARNEASEFRASGVDTATFDLDSQDGITLALEQLFTKVNDMDRANYEAVNGDVADNVKAERKARARALRKELLSCFRDHHGTYVSDMKTRWSEERDDYMYTVGLADLFVAGRSNDGRVKSGGRQFDRSAVRFDVPDHAGGKLRQDGEKELVYLQGTAFGLPRTPSYNGSMWLQTVRASLPATEVDNGDGTFSCGRDAMVMPDPQTLKILGCDHDGDKAQCYLYDVDPETGYVMPVDVPTDTSGLAGGDFARNGDARRNYLVQCMNAGLVRGDLEGQDERNGFQVSDYAKRGVSNRFVQGLLDMARNLPVENDEIAAELKANEDVGKAYRAGTLDVTSLDGRLRSLLEGEHPFYGTLMARATKAAPVSSAYWEAKDDAGNPNPKGIKFHADPSKEFMKNGNTLGKAFAAAHVATSSQEADRARGMVVSLASVLHIAMFSGKFGADSKFGKLIRTSYDNVMGWIDFMYRFDGISNATFDDIKEQICGKLGWTSGMMDTVLVDLITAEEFPTTDEQFAKILSDYADSIRAPKGGARGSSRYYMLVSSTAANNTTEMETLHAEIRSVFQDPAKPNGGFIYRGDVADRFGLYVDEDGNWQVDGAKTSPAYSAFANALMNAAEDAYRGQQTAPGFNARNYAINRMISDIAEHRGMNAGSGYAFWCLGEINASDDKETAAAKVAYDYFRWSEGRQAVSAARTFANSVNFTKADPGSGSKVGRREEFDLQNRRVLEDASETDTIEQALLRMGSAVQCQYNVPNLRTRQGRMSLAAETRDLGLVALANEINRRPGTPEPLRRVFAKLLGTTALSPSATLQLEGNLQTARYFLAAMQTMPACAGTDVMSGNGGLDAWDTFRAIASAEASRLVEGEKQAGNTLTLRSGIEALFRAQYLLVSTSRQANRFPGFAFFQTRADENFSPTGKGDFDYAFGGAELQTILAGFRNKDAESLRWVQRFVGDICNGAMDSVSRKAATGKTGATGFGLSVENLKAFEKELQEDVLRYETEKIARRKKSSGAAEASAKALAVVQRALAIMESIDAVKGKATEITPQMMFMQFIPTYSTFVQRVEGLENEGSASLLKMIPGAFERLSAQEAAYGRGLLDVGRTDTGYSLLDIVCSSNLGMVSAFATERRFGAIDAELKKGAEAEANERLRLKRAGQAAGDSKAKRAYAGVPVEITEDNLRKAVSAIASVDPDALDERGLSGTGEGMRAVEAVIGAMYPEVRNNPDGEHMVDIMGLGMMFRDLHEWANLCTADSAQDVPTEEEAKMARTELAQRTQNSEKSIPDGVKDPGVESICTAVRATLGAWWDVEYDGGDTFRIRQRFRGLGAARFNAGNGVDGVIEVHVGRPKGPTRQFNTNDPEIAASFCACAPLLCREDVHGNSITPEKLAALTGDERAALMGAFVGNQLRSGVNDFSTPIPDWTMTGEGVAVLTGHVNIADTSDAGKLFHEFFHSAIGMFRAMDMFSEEDVKALQQAFGKPAPGVDELFDEEKAAEAFRLYVKRNSKGHKKSRTLGEKVVEIFEKILSALEDFWHAMRTGFSYDDKANDNMLFRMVLTGYTGLSRSKVSNIVKGVTSDAAIARQYEGFKVKTTAPKGSYGYDSTWLEQIVKFGGMFSRELDRWMPAQPFSVDVTGGASDSVAEDFDPSTVSDPHETIIHNILMNELNREEGGVRKAPRPSLLRDLVTQLANLRAGNAQPEPALRVRTSLETDMAELAAEAEANAAEADAILAADSRKSASVASDPSRIPGPRTVARGGDAFPTVRVPRPAEPAQDGTVSAAIRKAMKPVMDQTPDAIVATTPEYSAAAAVMREAFGLATETDRGILLGINSKANWLDKAIVAARSKKALNRVAKRKELKSRMSKGISVASDLLGSPIGKSGSAYNLLARYYKFVQRMATDHSIRKQHASSADYAGFLLASAGPGVTMQVLADRLADRIKRSAARYAKRNGQIADVANELLARIRATDFSAEAVNEGTKFNEAMNGLMYGGILAGVVREYDAQTGEYGDFIPNDRMTDEAIASREALGFSAGTPGSREPVQKLLKDYLDGVNAINASAKFFRETGNNIAPGRSNPAFERAAAKVVPPLDFAELTKCFGIGENELLGESDLFGFEAQPSAILSNMDDWLASTVLHSFGNVPVRDSFMNPSAKLRANMSKFPNVNNFEGCYFGINRLEGRRLLRLIRVPKTHTWHDGWFHADAEGTAIGFDVSSGIQGKVTDVEFTEDEYRTVDIFLKSLLNRARGGKYYVTGVDGISFANYNERQEREAASRGDTRFWQGFTMADRDMFSREKVKEAIDEFYRVGSDVRSVPPAVWALDRMFRSLPEELLTGKFNLYNRFVDSMTRGIDRANRADEALAKDGRHVAQEEYNDIVLEQLERDGLVICDRLDRMSADGTHKLRRSGVLVFDAERFEREVFSKGNSSAFDKLLQAGRDEKRLSGKATIERYVKPYIEFIEEVKKMPWLTSGDGKFFNNVGTPIPNFIGSGNYMYAANRLARNDRSAADTAAIRIAKHERTFLAQLANWKALEKPISEASASQLDMLRDYFPVQEKGISELREAIMNGEYAPGSKKAADTGLVLSPSGTCQDVTTAIYYRLLEKRMSAIDGSYVTSEVDNPGALKRMIEAYEDSRGGEATVSSGGFAYGLTDEQVFRIHGQLPANYQIGHAIQTAMKGIADAIQFRSTLTTFMMTKGRDQKPVVYVKPSETAVQAGGITDAVWGALAKWWHECNPETTGKYDITKTGVENARRMYDELVAARGNAGGKLNGKKVTDLARSDIDAPSVDAVMAVADDEDDPNVSKLNRVAGNKLHLFDGGEAIGYAKHLFQTSRVLGSTARTVWMNRIMAWSKSLSVAFSFFFPLATKWESPTAAVGVLATMGSNWSPEFVRKHAGALKKVQGLFSGGNGWVDSDFLGFKDVMRMMDTNDPFLADLIRWAECLGISMSDRTMNPMEPARGMVASNVAHMTKLVEGRFGKRTARLFNSTMEAVVLRSGEKAFSYALNATKLAVAAQVAMKLKAEAERQGKAFDPIRDMRKYAGYVDSEVGGVNPLRYAWAHPMMRSMMNCLFFSWEWTRTAWEAGGGTIFEDMIFGGHSFSGKMRGYYLGRWIRMFASVMIGVPMFAQLVIKALAIAMGRDDDDDKWWTFENEDKAHWTAFDLTPLLKALGDCPDCAGKGRGYDGLTGFGKALNAVATNLKGVPILGNFVPSYTGGDTANKTTRNRRYYMHFGKQGWEFFRWFTDPGQQLFSKLSMPVQRMAEGVFGRNLSYLDRELAWENYGAVERWLTADGAGVNMLKAFLPFTYNGISTFGDAGALSMFGPVQMGASQSGIVDRMAAELVRWADNDRRGYAFGGKKRGKAAKYLVPVLSDLVREARLNGHDPDELVTRAVAKVTSRYYHRLFDALPSTPDGDFDIREVEKCIRSLNRLGRKYKDAMDNIKKHVKWETTPPENRAAMRSAFGAATSDPFGSAEGAYESLFRQDRDAREYLNRKVDY